MFAQLGERAEMRPLLPDHAGELADCVDRHRVHLAKWTVLASRVHDAETARELLAHYVDPPCYFGIWIDNTLSGGALFRVFDARKGVCEIGGWLTPEIEGRGLITLAFRQLIEWARSDCGIRRIELRTSTENVRARAIAQRLGMTLDTTLRRSFQLDGVWHDTEVWSSCADMGAAPGKKLF